MKPITKKLSSALALGLVSITQLNAEVAMSPDQTAVLQTVLGMTRAFEAGDLENVMSRYQPDAVVLFEPGAASVGTPALRAGFEGMAAMSPRFEYGGHEVNVSGDMALHIAPWTMRAKAPDGSEISGQGLSLAVLRRQPDGSWKMLIDNPYGGRLLDAGGDAEAGH